MTPPGLFVTGHMSRMTNPADVGTRHTHTRMQAGSRPYKQAVLLLLRVCVYIKSK